eukprot:1161682-Pelagomonas_calceolata.AAC.2
MPHVKQDRISTPTLNQFSANQEQVPQTSGPTAAHHEAHVHEQAKIVTRHAETCLHLTIGPAAAHHEAHAHEQETIFTRHNTFWKPNSCIIAGEGDSEETRVFRQGSRSTPSAGLQSMSTRRKQKQGMQGSRAGTSIIRRMNGVTPSM